MGIPFLGFYFGTRTEVEYDTRGNVFRETRGLEESLHNSLGTSKERGNLLIMSKGRRFLRGTVGRSRGRILKVRRKFCFSF